MKFQTTLFIKDSNVKSSETDESVSDEASIEISAIKIFMNKFLSDNNILIEDGSIMIDVHPKEPIEVFCVDIQPPYDSQLTKILMDHLEKRRRFS